MKLAVTLCMVLVCARVASAQPVKLAEPPPVLDEGDINPVNCVLLSLGGTAVGWGLLVASAHMRTSDATTAMALTGAVGTLVGPSLGHWYARSFWSRGLGIRLASLATASVGFAMFARHTFDHKESGGDDLGFFLFVAGGFGYVTGSFYDISMASAAADHYNARNHQLSVLPVVNPATRSYGLALGGRF